MPFILSFTTIITWFLVLDLSQAKNVIPGRYIMEFTDESTADIDAFYRQLANSAIIVTPYVELNYELFKGCSFQLDGDSDEIVVMIKSMDIVKDLWPVRVFDRPLASVTSIARLDSACYGCDEFGLHKRQSTGAELLDNNYPHRMTGVDKLNAEGYTGKGILVAVIDTGVDYRHPALGGCFGEGCKVKTGYDLVGSDFNGYNTPIPDDDPLPDGSSDSNEHGTHISGIIAANPNEYNFTGVVPDAELAHYKIFGKNGTTTEDVVIRAFNIAYESGADVISASFGSAGGWPDRMYKNIVSRIAKKGVVCVLSAGNEGSSGLFYANTPADSTGAIAVGSVDNVVTPELLVEAYYSTSSSNTSLSSSSRIAFGYKEQPAGDFGTVSVPLFAISLNSNVTADACQPVNGTDLSPYLVLIRRGTCNFQTKINYVVSAGAKRVMFYNSDDSALAVNSATGVPFGYMRREIAEAWLTALNAGQNVTVDLVALADAKQNLASRPNNASGGGMSSFSSWSPTYEGYVKPEVSAPGAGILSTFSNDSYAVMDGTSMSTPFIAGVIGLVMQVKGKNTLNPFQMASLLETTAKPLKYNDGSVFQDFFGPVPQQGGGLVDAYPAAYTKTLLGLDNIALNDTQYFVPSHPLTITNLGDEARTYSFEHIIAATVFTLNGSSPSPTALTALQFDASAKAGASVTFDPANITVPAKEVGVVTIKFTPPEDLDASRIPVYSGFVAINNSLGESLTLPYMGLATNMTTVQLMNTQKGYPWLAASKESIIQQTSSSIKAVLPSNVAIAEGFIFTLPESNSSTNLNKSELIYPTSVFNLAMGSRLLRVDVLPLGANATQLVLGEQALEISVLPIPNRPWDYPGVIVPRNDERWAQWDGTLRDGSKAPVGKYKFLTRVLKIMGDEKSPTAYERYESREFDIVYS